MKTKQLIISLFTIISIGITTASLYSCSEDDNDDPKSVVDNNSGDNKQQGKTEFNVATGETANISSGSVTLYGKFNSNTQPSTLGFLISKSANLSISNYEKKEDIENTNDTQFSKTISGLASNTKYYYRVYASYNNEYYYGDIMSFTTTTEKEKEALIKMSLVSRTGTSFKIKFDISSDVDYYFCNVGNYITNTSKYSEIHESKVITFSDLKIGKEYTITAVPYTKDGKKGEAIQAKFSTASSPYTNYICVSGTFYKVTGAKRWVKRDYSGTGTGTHWKNLDLTTDDDVYVRFSYSVHEWDGISSVWQTGTYRLTDGHSYYTYSGFYYNGSKPRYFSDGDKMTIKKNNGTTIIDFSCEDRYNSDKYYGHVETIE